MTADLLLISAVLSTFSTTRPEASVNRIFSASSIKPSTFVSNTVTMFWVRFDMRFCEISTENGCSHAACAYPVQSFVILCMVYGNSVLFMYIRERFNPFANNTDINQWYTSGTICASKVDGELLIHRLLSFLGNVFNINCMYWTPFTSGTG